MEMCFQKSRSRNIQLIMSLPCTAQCSGINLKYSFLPSSSSWYDRVIFYRLTEIFHMKTFQGNILVSIYVVL